MTGIVTTRIANEGPLRLDLHWRDVKNEGAKKVAELASSLIRQRVEQEAGLPAARVAKVTKDGFIGHDGAVLVPMQQGDWAKMRQALIKARAKDPHIPDPTGPNIPEEPLHKAGRASVAFQNIAASHYLDGIPYSRKPRLDGESDTAYIRRLTRELAGDEYDPASSKTRDSLNGMAQSIVPRQHYEMTIQPEGHMAEFLGREEPFVSREIFARNGYVDGAVTSSFLRFADRPTLLRAIEAEDGSIDIIPGRASNLATATEIGKFAFLSQMNLLRDPEKAHLAEGIERVGNEYVFEFLPQSLLPMYGGAEKKMFQKLQKAYEELAKEPVDITDPANPALVYRVRFRPLPAAASQFNYANTLEEALPGAVSGEFAARDTTIKSDKALFRKVDTMSEEFIARRAARFGVDRGRFLELVADTRYFLEKQDNLWPWQSNVLAPHEELMARAFLSHLLGIPMIDNCKSLVDRTNVLNAMVTSMKQWLRSKAPLPEKEGRVAIFDLPKVAHAPLGAVNAKGQPLVYYPFKELFAYNLHKGVKISEFSRGEKGFKFNRGLFQHPALKFLLPVRYLKKKEEPVAASRFKRWALPIAGWILPPTLFQTFAWCGLKATGAHEKEIDRVWIYQKKLRKKGVVGKIAAVALSIVLTLIPVQLLVWGASILYSLRYIHKPWRIASTVLMPFKMIKNGDAMNPRLHVNEKYRESGQKQLLYGGSEADPLLFEDSDS